MNRFTAEICRVVKKSLQRAIELAPDVYPYHNLLATVYTQFYLDDGQDQGGKERECSLRAEYLPYEECLARKAQASNLRAQTQRPLNNRAVFQLIETTVSLATIAERHAHS